MPMQPSSHIKPTGGDPEVGNCQIALEPNHVATKPLTVSAAKLHRQSPAIKVHQGLRPFVCHICQMPFTRLENLKRHMQRHQRTEKFKCETCNKEFSRRDTLRQHIRSQHPFEYEVLVDVKDARQRASMVENKLRERRPRQAQKIKQALFWQNIFVPGTSSLNAVEMSNQGMLATSLRSNYQEDQIIPLLQNYWTHFHPLFPLIHRPTFDYRTANWLLVNAMSAVGALYSSELKVHSNVLCENTLKSIYESIFNEEPPIQVLQAALILTFYGIYTDRICYKGSRTLYTLLVTVAREIGIFQSSPDEEYGDDWGSFIASEGRKRTSCCLYMVDSQMAILLNYPPSLSFFEVKHALPCSDELWEVATAFEWTSLCSSNPASTQVIQFLPALQQTLIYGRCPKHMSSFGSLNVLLAIHVMIRDTAKYAGILGVRPFHTNDPFSRRSQLGDALNALRTLIPKKKNLLIDRRENRMWEMFIATWNLAYIHLHIPDPMVTGDIIEVTLRASIVTAAALARSHQIDPLKHLIVSNDFMLIPLETLSVVVNHVRYFLKFSAKLCVEDTREKSPILTFMLYKASLVAWQILNNFIHCSKTEEEEKSRKGMVDSAYIRRRLIDDIMNCVDDYDSHEDDDNKLKRFESWIRNIFSSASTWSVGPEARASFDF